MARRASVVQLTTITGDYHTAFSLLLWRWTWRSSRAVAVQRRDLMGRVAEGNTSIRASLWVVLEEGADATEAISAITAKFGGQADAMANTMVGASQRMSVALVTSRKRLVASFCCNY
jgi:hypothetical protein